MECKERRSSIKAALRPVLSRKSRSDLAKYSRPNFDHKLKQGPLERNGSKNSVKDGNFDWITAAKNGKGKETKVIIIILKLFSLLVGLFRDNDTKNINET